MAELADEKKGMKDDKLNVESIKIKDLAKEDRPREKLRRIGAAGLTDAELLAILIGSGYVNTSSVKLMEAVLASNGNSLNALGRMSIEDLMKYKGIGEAKAITLLAACELGSRRRREDVVERKRITSAADVCEYFDDMRLLPLEECRLLMLRQNRGIIGSALISKGGLTGTAVDVREVLRHALLNRAVAIVLCHNHPSGNLSPSTEDNRLTRSVQEGCRAVNIMLMDHVIVSSMGYYSYNEQGKL